MAKHTVDSEINARLIDAMILEANFQNTVKVSTKSDRNYLIAFYISSLISILTVINLNIRFGLKLFLLGMIMLLEFIYIASYFRWRTPKPTRTFIV